jgi:glycerol uptake facilitator-like aquaporin
MVIGLNSNIGGLTMKKAIAEFIGTFALVFIGCGTIVVGGMATGATAINELAIALASASALWPWLMALVRFLGATSIQRLASASLPQVE